MSANKHCSLNLLASCLGNEQYRGFGQRYNTYLLMLASQVSRSSMSSPHLASPSPISSTERTYGTRSPLLSARDTWHSHDRNCACATAAPLPVKDGEASRRLPLLSNVAVSQMFFTSPTHKRIAFQARVIKYCRSKSHHFQVLSNYK